MSTVLIPQPLYAPAPYVAYGTNPAHCYANPIQVSENVGTAYDSLDVRAYATSDYCGKLISYTDCSGGNSLVVAYPAPSSPHAYVLYGATCYAYNGTTTSVGTASLTVAGSITPVAGCDDVLCTKADANGNSYVYFDGETGQRQAVEFSHLDVGIPHFGVAPQRQDGSTTLPAAGTARVHLVRSLVRLGSSTGTGDLVFTFSPTPFSKDLVIERAGIQYAHSLSAHQRTFIASVQPADIFYVRVVGASGQLPPQAKGAALLVSWMPYVALPRVYDSVSLGYSGTVLALGFCGLTSHQDYTFYGTLPSDVVSSHPQNPGGLVTFQGAAEPEQLVIRSRGSGMPSVATSLPWYGGGAFTSPITVRFYATIPDLDAHGEMDLWLDSDGTFPGVLRVDSYRTLVASGSSYRKTTEIGDAARNSVEVASAVSYLPRVFGASDGELAVVQSQAGTVTLDSKVFLLQGTDQGIAYQVRAG